MSANNRSIQTAYCDNQTFVDKYGNNNKLSMFHLNIRSVPDHFLEFSLYIESLKIKLKIIALSETWINHTAFNIPNYSIKQHFRPKKHGSGVILYLHSSLQYKSDRIIQLEKNPEITNTDFVEIEKNTHKHNVIIGCI